MKISILLPARLRPGRPRVTLADVAAFPVVCLPCGTGIRTVFDRACAAKGLHPDIAFQASAPAAVADLALRGLGVAVLSETTAAPYAEQLAGLVIEDVDTLTVLALIWSRTMNPALRELLGHCRREFTN